MLHTRVGASPLTLSSSKTRHALSSARSLEKMISMVSKEERTQMLRKSNVVPSLDHAVVIADGEQIVLGTIAVRMAEFTESNLKREFRI